MKPFDSTLDSRASLRVSGSGRLPDPSSKEKIFSRELPWATEVLS
jgi:hypothetical protein